MKEKFSLTGVLTVLGFLLLISAFIVPFFISDTFASVFGDSSTPLVSAAAFLLLIAANLMNQNELKLQREELQLQREELQKTTQALNDQYITMERQRFETTFFNLVNSHLEIKKQITIERNGKELEGFDALDDLYLRVGDDFNNLKDCRSESKGGLKFFSPDELDSRLINFSNYFVDKYNNQLSTYISSFKYILEYIQGAENEENYKKLLFSQTSNSEMIILFYISFSDVLLKKILKQNDWLNLRPENLIANKHFKILTENQ
ncbi:hypothetical protein [Sporosarcina ureae]|uniref:hypothetical protein n=1 Tax=Sporosarcina ureae TaxID=1571 RepID=UPI000A17E5B0|nr:hypothetical protein [Sporosarcina ureae]ARK22475.1 hypothetical protein SporoP32a_13575 [Sporosarcina ureae]